MSGDEEPRRRRLVLWTVLVVLLLVAAAAAMAATLYRGATVARAELTSSRASMQAFVGAVASGDVEAADDHLTAASESVAEADEATSGPVWQLATHMPVAGRSPRIVQQVVAVAEASVRLGRRASEAVPELLSETDEGLRVDDGAFDLRRLELAVDALGRLPVDALDFAREALASTRTGGVPEVLLEGRRDALELADETVRTVRNAETALGVLPRFLGRDGERSYLLAVQSSAELRGTGGLLGYVGVLAVDRGEMRLADTGVIDPTADEAGDGERGPTTLTELGGALERPVPTPEDFRERYEHVAADRLFSNVNVDPHLPMTAPVVLDLYAAQTGRALDGVIALDPVGMGMLLATIGPIQVPTASLEDTAGLPTTIPAADVARVTTIDVYETFGADRTQERAAYFEAVSRGAFHRIFGGSWNALPVARQLAEATRGRHVQLFSRDEAEQQAFEQLGVAGSVALPARGDVLAVTANNAVGGKQDVHVAHRFAADIALGEVVKGPDGPAVQRTAAVEISLENPLPASGRDTYIIGNCLVGLGRNACFEGPAGTNRTWFTLWAPDTTHFLSGRDAEGGAPLFHSDQIHGHTAIDHFLETPAESTAAFEISATGPVKLSRDGGDLVYQLTLWRQAKAIPDHWDVRITPPAGFSVSAVSVAGGGAGRGMGVGGEAVPLEARIDGGAARLTGSSTADLVLDVRFRQGR